MRKIAGVFIVFALMSSTGFAQENSEHLEHLEHLRAMMHTMSQHGPVIPQPDGAINTLDAKAINITALVTTRSGSFTCDPSSGPSNTFTVNQGDVVTLNVVVGAGDTSTANPSHILRMDTYVEQGLNVVKGRNNTVTFTATTPGNFFFVCNQPTCSTSFHSSMIGQMIVNAQANPAPTISSISPNSGPRAGGTSVTISGTNFSSGATVTFGGNAVTNVNVTSGTTITATTPAHNEGAVDVTVTNSDGQSATFTQGFTYAGLKITSVSPSTGSTSGGTNVTIKGSAFQSGATVTFGGVAATNVNVVDSTTIVATTPLGPATEQLMVDVVVKNPDGSTATLHPGFTYSVPPLSVTSISPAVGVTSGGTVVTISGTGFTTALNSAVTFGGVAATNVTIVDAVTIQVTAPAHAAGSVDVAVMVGGLSVVKTGAFTYETVPPRHRSARH